ncbi:triacylglycerol lipase OBL1-like [Curcuma longa]|uniref:triacylglycerol lipase OBL1-like n=1 Tax=Curcuma longa TaxID=136217 RepID=UPI003D9E29F8
MDNGEEVVDDDEQFIIIRRDQLSYRNLFRSLSFPRQRQSFADYAFVDSFTIPKSGTSTGDNQRRCFCRRRSIRSHFFAPLTGFAMKTLLQVATPLKLLGLVVEFLLNLISLNGGILGLIWRLMTVRVKIPRRGTAEFRSVLAFVDDRVELDGKRSLKNFTPLMELKDHGGLGDVNIFDLTMMASKISYENKEYIKNVVDNHWKMYFVGFYNCWNKFLESNGTQAFIFCNKREDADLIVLAFRGTEPFNAYDWSTDVDLSVISAGKLGFIHLGFLKALGLQDEKIFHLGFPEHLEIDENKPAAYYVLRGALSELLAAHPKARIIVTGHSLGGALAAIFPAILSCHGDTGGAGSVLSSVAGVMTYGQPRVGDEKFKAYFELLMQGKLYVRMVYRFDLVSRIPFDDYDEENLLSPFTHCGKCIFFNGWYRAKLLEEVPQPNSVDLMTAVPRMYLSLWTDLFNALFAVNEGREFKEGLWLILFRLVGGHVCPGGVFHSPRDYVNAARLAKLDKGSSALLRSKIVKLWPK